MTVAELIAELQKHDGDRVIVLRSDADEWDTYSPLDSICTDLYCPVGSTDGTWFPEHITDDTRSRGWKEEARPDCAQPAVFLHPANI